MATETGCKTVSVIPEETRTSNANAIQTNYCRQPSWLNENPKDQITTKPKYYYKTNYQSKKYQLKRIDLNST